MNCQMKSPISNHQHIMLIWTRIQTVYLRVFRIIMKTTETPSLLFLAVYARNENNWRTAELRHVRQIPVVLLHLYFTV
jgi:hypothetical protein